MQFKTTVLISLVFMISAYYLNLIASTSSIFFPFSILFPGNLVLLLRFIKAVMGSEGERR